MAAVTHVPTGRADWWGARHSEIVDALRFIAKQVPPKTLAGWLETIVTRVPDANRAGFGAREELKDTLLDYLLGCSGIDIGDDPPYIAVVGDTAAAATRDDASEVDDEDVAWWRDREAGVFEVIRFIGSGSVPNTLAKWRQQIITRVPDANRAGPAVRPILDAALVAYLREVHEVGDIRMSSMPARITLLYR